MSSEGENLESFFVYLCQAFFTDTVTAGPYLIQCSVDQLHDGPLRIKISEMKIIGMAGEGTVTFFEAGSNGLPVFRRHALFHLILREADDLIFLFIQLFCEFRSDGLCKHEFLLLFRTSILEYRKKYIKAN
jgi:hypothetical protein